MDTSVFRTLLLENQFNINKAHCKTYIMYVFNAFQPAVSWRIREEIGELAYMIIVNSKAIISPQIEFSI